jgi:hypothetical protein
LLAASGGVITHMYCGRLQMLTLETDLMSLVNEWCN